MPKASRGRGSRGGIWSPDRVVVEAPRREGINCRQPLADNHGRSEGEQAGKR